MSYATTSYFGVSSFKFINEERAVTRLATPGNQYTGPVSDSDRFKRGCSRQPAGGNRGNDVTVRPQKPKLSPEAEAELRLMGLEAVRDWLNHAPRKDFPTTFVIGNVKLSREQLIAWIQWHEDIAARRNKFRFWSTFVFVVIGATAAVVGAIPAVGPLLRSLRRPLQQSLQPSRREDEMRLASHALASM